MYFNEKNDTNIDLEFEDDNIISKVLHFINKYKIILGIILLLIIIFLIIFIVSFNKKNTNYLTLIGEENITIYQGEDYIELGYTAYNSKKENLNNQVKITTNLDVNVVGEYEILYQLDNIHKIRKVTVIEKPVEYTYIYLKTIDNNVNIYLKKGEEYVEPGYQVFSSIGLDLTDKVQVSGEVNTNKKGSYKLIYSVKDSNNVTISASRTIIVMDTDINLTLSTNEYTNNDVLININVIDEYFDYLVLPNNKEIITNSYSYKVSTNGVYKFKVYNKKGLEKSASIEVKNIDKDDPSGNCTIDYSNSGSIITISASDNSGIKKYLYNGKEYTTNKITLSAYIDNAKINIYDNAGNSKEISCKSVAIPVITDIKNDGVIVTINVKKANSDISGYYFSYTNERPNKDSSGYLSTSQTSIDVVRLAGTTYVWVEDKSGKISKPATITLATDVIPLTKGSGYSVLKETKLSDYLANKGWSLEELNKLMARSVRAAGIHTKIGAATAAVSLEAVLAQKYKIKIPYWRGGKTSSMGAYGSWGMYRENPTYAGYNYYGMDCDGLVNWSYKNAGISYSSITENSYYNWSGIEFNKDNGEIGDIIKKTGHVAIIVGKTDSAFIVAEAYGESVGIIINTYPYNNSSGYTIIKGERLIETYEKIQSSEYPSGF